MLKLLTSMSLVSLGLVQCRYSQRILIAKIQKILKDLWILGFPYFGLFGPYFPLVDLPIFRARRVLSSRICDPGRCSAGRIQ